MKSHGYMTYLYDTAGFLNCSKIKLFRNEVGYVMLDSDDEHYLIT